MRTQKSPLNTITINVEGIIMHVPASLEDLISSQNEITTRAEKLQDDGYFSDAIIQYKEAIKLLKQILTVIEKNKGTKSDDYYYNLKILADSYFNIAECYESLGNAYEYSAQAELNYIIALDKYVYLKSLVKNSVEKSQCERDVQMTQQRINNFKKKRKQPSENQSNVKKHKTQKVSIDSNNSTVFTINNTNPSRNKSSLECAAAILQLSQPVSQPVIVNSPGSTRSLAEIIGELSTKKAELEKSVKLLNYISNVMNDIVEIENKLGYSTQNKTLFKSQSSIYYMSNGDLEKYYHELLTTKNNLNDSLKEITKNNLPGFSLQPRY